MLTGNDEAIRVLSRQGATTRYPGGLETRLRIEFPQSSRYGAGT